MQKRHNDIRGYAPMEKRRQMRGGEQSETPIERENESRGLNKEGLDTHHAHKRLIEWMMITRSGQGRCGL